MESIVLDAHRRLTAAPAEARLAVVRNLRTQGFTITAEQVSLVRAKRGSQVFGTVQPDKLPVTATVTIAPTDAGCDVTVRLADDWKSGAGRVWGEAAPFRAVLDAVQGKLDDVLRPFAAGRVGPAPEPEAEPVPVEPDPASTPAAAPTTTSDATTAVLEKGNAVASRVGGRVDELLTGQRSRLTAPRTLKEVVLRCSQGIVSYDRTGIQGLLTVGLLVSSKPGSMPANLARDVEALSTRIESAVARQPQGRVIIELADDEIPVAEFVAKQAELREQLPLRTLHVCTTCKLERVVNPDFAKLQEKIQRKKVLTGAIGGTISGKGLSPFLVVGSLFKLKNFDTQFVCQRCQGLDADSSIVTYCPRCGERHSEAVLRVCPRCDLRFASVLQDRGEFWGPDDIPVAAVPATPPAALARPAAAAPDPAAGWYPDQTGRHSYRYWDGTAWTGHVRG